MLTPLKKLETISLDQIVFEKTITIQQLHRDNIDKLPVQNSQELFNFQDDDKLYAQFRGQSKKHLVDDKFSLLDEPLVEFSANYAIDGNLRSMDFIFFSIDESNPLEQKNSLNLEKLYY